MEQQQREMNLFDLCRAFFQWIGKCFMWLWQLIARMLRLTFRQWWIVLIVVAACVALGLYYARPANRMYKVNAIATLNGVTNDIVRNEYMAFDKSHRLSEKQNLPAMLGVSPDIAHSTSHFKTFDVIDCLGDSLVDYIDYKDKVTRMDTNLVHMPYMLALQFRTKNPDNVPAIEEGILRYLNSRPYITQLYSVYRSNLERETRFHHDQLEKLDSLTSSFYFAQNVAQQIQFSPWETGMVIGRREIRLFLEDIYTEMGMLHLADQRMALCTAPVVLQSHFIVEPRAVNGYFKCTVIAIIIGWLLGLMVAALVENRKAILAWLKQK